MNEPATPAEVGLSEGLGGAVPKCACGDRAADTCPGKWEPGCNLGANAKYARRASPDVSAQVDAALGLKREPQPGSRWTVERLARAATRLMGTFERRTEVAEDVIDAAEVLREQRDMLELHYLTPEAAHEASQGAYMQAAHLEWQANNNPDPHRRNDLMRRAYTALEVARKLSILGQRAG